MAGKHQIWSSNKRTRQRANRCWRRQNRERLRDEATSEGAPPGPQSTGDPKSGKLVYADRLEFGTSLGSLMPTPGEEPPIVEPREFSQMIARWRGLSLADYRTVLSDVHEDLLLEYYQMFQVDPLEQYLALTPTQQARLVACLGG